MEELQADKPYTVHGPNNQTEDITVGCVWNEEESKWSITPKGCSNILQAAIRMNEPGWAPALTEPYMSGEPMPYTE